MSALNLPATWGRMSQPAKANYLVDSHQAPTYSVACAILAHGRRKPGRPLVVVKPHKLGQSEARKAFKNWEDQWWNK